MRLSIYVFGLLLVLGPAGAGQAETADTATSPTSCTPARQQALRAIVERKLGSYRDQFPDIEFVLLSGRDQREQAIVELLWLLGDGAANLDYEHPPELRADLLQVSLARIAVLMRYGASSSALFQVGTNGQSPRPRLCVLTLDACTVAKDDRQATSYMLDLPEQEFARMPENQHLDADLHLEYVIDHEIHHCLMAHRGEPIPMSTRKFWPGYMQRRNEMAADAYGLAMHILKFGPDSQYVRTLIAVRGLSLMAGDPDHYTPVSMGATLENLCQQVDSGSALERALAVATTVRDTLDRGYEDYLKYRYAAYLAMRRLGVEDDVGPSVLARLPGYQPDPARVDKLLHDTSMHYQLLFGGPLTVGR
jgi:hypothetical protein